MSMHTYAREPGHHAVTVRVNSLPDFTLREVSVKISESKTTEELQQTLSEEDAITLLDESGYTKPITRISVDDKGVLLSTITTYHLFIKVKAMMDQFRDGLEQSGALGYMRRYTDQLRSFFVNERNPLTAVQIKDMFKVTFSDSGTRQRELQEQSYVFFGDFLDLVEDKQIDGCTLGDVLSFFSGADYPPPLGFNKKPQLQFLANEGKKILPTASTCALTLWLPTCHMTGEDFNQSLRMAILDNDGFGGGP